MMTPPASPTLTADNLTIALPPRDTPFVVFRNFTLNLAVGQITCLLGAPGAGKTTLLKALSGAIRFDPPGGVLFKGQMVSQTSREILMVSPDEGLDPDLSARANLTAGAGKGIPDAAKREALVTDLLEFLGLSGSADLLPYQLSRGMRQRAAVARALASMPEALLLDEPFSALDPQSRSQLRDLLFDFQEDAGMTMVVVTHHVEDAILLGSRIVVLGGHPAEIVQDVDVSAETYNNPDNPAFI